VQYRIRETNYKKKAGKQSAMSSIRRFSIPVKMVSKLTKLTTYLKLLTHYNSLITAVGIR
jgi:hypothetical protein